MTPYRFLSWTVKGHLALLPVLLLFAWLDPRELAGANLWWKPIKFFVSVAVYLPTVRYLLQWTSGRTLRWVGYGTALTMIGENLAVGGQAARGVASHFNGASVFDAVVFALMGVLIMINTLLLTWLLGWHCANRVPTGAGQRWGIRWGLLATLLASVIGGLMIANQGHTFGAPDGDVGLPFLNWSLRAGDLRIAHFMGLHGMQALPLLGWAVDRSGTPRGWLLVAVAAVAYLAAVALLMLQALGGKPLVAWLDFAPGGGVSGRLLQKPRRQIWSGQPAHFLTAEPLVAVTRYETVDGVAQKARQHATQRHPTPGPAQAGGDAQGGVAFDVGSPILNQRHTVDGDAILGSQGRPGNRLQRGEAIADGRVVRDDEADRPLAEVASAIEKNDRPQAPG